MSGERDMTPAVGTPAEPASWERADEYTGVALHRRGWVDAVWSFLYRDDTRYAATEPPPPGFVEAANRDGRAATPDAVQGPLIKPPVWTWEIPLYFWFGGMAAGSSFVALACDLSGDERSARIARRVALGAIAPSPPLLILDLGRPERFYNMLRIFKPRSPMSMGAWALFAFSNLIAGAVGADLLGRKPLARALGAGGAVVGGYFGSYTGVLLASTAVPLWSRSRLFLGPIFVATATATGAAATRLVLSASGVRAGHPTRLALARIEAAAMGAELVLSQLNERRLGDAGRPLREGRLFRAAKWLVRAGMGLQLARRQHAASVSYLGAGLCFRFAWVEAGRESARDDQTVARTARVR